MKKLTILFVFICILSVQINAQSRRVGFKEYFERAYPWYNFTITMGTGVFPYGLNFTNEMYSDDEDYTTFRGFDESMKIGISYNFKELPLGFFVEGSLWSIYSGTKQLPYPRSKMDINLSRYFITHAVVMSSGFNAGLLYGGEVARDFELFGKLGYGITWHDYFVLYKDGIINQSYEKTGITNSNNYQFAVDFRFFPAEIIGISTSIGIAQNFPLFSISAACKFGYKARKIEE